MNRLKFLAAVFVVLVIGFTSCQKELQISDDQNSLNLSSRSSDTNELSEAEIESLKNHVFEIKNFREKIHLMKESSSNENMDALNVIEKTEIAFNLYLGKPTTVFSEYHSINKSIKVSANTIWEVNEIVKFYEDVKEFVVETINNQESFLHIMSLTNPIETEDGLIVEAFISVGKNPINEVNEFAFHDGTRWTNAPRGFTNPTPCGGAANFDIGAAANQQIGIYQPINAGPGSGGNTPLSGKIVSRIVYGDHSYVVSNFPQGTPFPKVYDIVTRGTGLSSLHYNSEAVAPNVPDWNCLSNIELINLTFGNLQLATNGLQFVPPVQIGSFSFPRRLVCTAVGSLAADAGIPAAPPINEIPIKFQDHPTRHYFGRVVNKVVFEETEQLPDLGPIDM